MGVEEETEKQREQQFRDDRDRRIPRNARDCIPPGEMQTTCYY